MPVKLTIVRHGESTDNLGSVWAGFKDAPLSNHGMNQAKAVGQALRREPIDLVVASPLLRARWTAEQIHTQNTASPALGPIAFSPLVKEQNFGLAEGQSWEPGRGGFVRGSGRAFRFPEGESLRDVGRRADEAIDTFILPLVLASAAAAAAGGGAIDDDASTATAAAAAVAAAAEQGRPVHIVLVAHGIFNSELVGALLRRRTNDGNLDRNEARTGPMTNTGFHHILLDLAAKVAGDPPALTPSAAAAAAASSSSTTLDDGAPLNNPSSLPPSPPPTTPAPPTPSSSSPSSSSKKDDAAKPRLAVQIVTVNSTSHLEAVKRQKGGIGSAAFDAKQQSLRDFISGGGQAKV